jgi:hypothetical protein
LFKTQCFRDWILSATSGGTYSVWPNQYSQPPFDMFVYVYTFTHTYRKWKYHEAYIFFKNMPEFRISVINIKWPYCSSNLKTMHIYCFSLGKMESEVRIAIDYGFDSWGVWVRDLTGPTFSFSPCCPDQFWGRNLLLSNWHKGLFLWGQSGRRVKLTTHQPVPWLRVYGSIHLLPHTSKWQIA